MDIRPIHTKADYMAALKIVSELVKADPQQGTPDGDRLEILSTLLGTYEAQHYPIELPDPKLLVALADGAKGAADRAGTAIDDALSFIAESNKRIASMEARAAKSGQDAVKASL